MKNFTFNIVRLIAMTITFNDKLSKIVHACKLNKEKQKRLYLFSIMNLFFILLSTSCLSPLLTAVNKNNTKEAETLINNGADVNKKSLGATPLYTAVYRNNPEIVRLLLDKGADVNENSGGGWRPMHMAVKNGNAEIVKLLIEKGADINVPNPFGKTPLIVAQENGSTAIVSLLNGDEVIPNEDLAIKRDTTTANVADSIQFSTLAAKYREMEVKPVVTEQQRKYIVQANSFAKDKIYTQAIEAYKKAIAIDPVAYPAAYYNLALLLAEKKDFREAIKSMKKYLLLVPDAPDARAAQDKIYEWER